MMNAKYGLAVEVSAIYLKALRKAVGRQIDPETAEVFCDSAQVLDPYGDHPNFPKEVDCVGTVYFARSPGSDVCISFDDLPLATRDALWKKLKEENLGFPAGLEGIDKL
jgi:hypothetical protein